MGWEVLYKIIEPFVRFYWFIFRPKTFGVKCVVESKDGEILMIRNNYGYKRWTFPGGGLKKGESPEAAARREVLEETGLELSGVSFIGEFDYSGEYKKDTIKCFCGKAVSKEFKIEPSEVKEARWFKADELPEPLSPISEKILKLSGRKPPI